MLTTEHHPNTNRLGDTLLLSSLLERQVNPSNAKNVLASITNRNLISMNGSDFPTPSYGQDSGWGGRMKAFFLLVLLFLAFIFFASSSMSSADLNPYASTSSGAVPVPATGADVITIQDTPVSVAPAVQSNYGVPVTGTCSNPYTIRSGDMLSQIAVICNTTVASIRQANPSITNANLIYPGQQLVIPSGNSQPAVQPQAQVVPTQPVPVTGVDNSKNPGVTLPAIPQTGRVPLLIAGSQVQVKALNYPPNTPVNIAIGPQNASANVVATSITDASGSLVSLINVPNAPDAQTPWVVTVTSNGAPAAYATSQPFYIGPQ